jgi:hypothetical protein
MDLVGIMQIKDADKISKQRNPQQQAETSKQPQAGGADVAPQKSVNEPSIQFRDWASI